MNALGLTIFRSYSDVLFMDGVALGVVLLLLSLLNPNLGLAGLLAVISAYGFARLINMDREFLNSGIYTYNPLLVGLSIGYRVEMSWLSASFVVYASVMTLLVSVMMSSVFHQYLNLPVLSLPFVVTSAIADLAIDKYSNLLIRSSQSWLLLPNEIAIPYILRSFFQSLGAIFFMPTTVVGLVISIMLLWHSRILFGLAVTGFYVGTMIRGAMLGSYPQAFDELLNFNFILIAMSVGSVFLVASPKSFLFAGLAVAVSTIFLDAVIQFGALQGIPVYTLPFNVVSLSFIYVLLLTGHPTVARIVCRTPEETLEHELVSRWRFSSETRTVQLPFFGNWTVWQGDDDIWTHHGPWKHAIDFVITDEMGNTYRGVGDRCEDYYCFHKPIASPVRGRVIAVVKDLPDNEIGTVDKENNWGNHLVIQDERGFHVEISHLEQDSITIDVGDWVEPGTTIGNCGNSGYSPQPHLHLQVQAGPEIGTGTLPFTIASYLNDDSFCTNRLPEKGDIVQRGATEKTLARVTDFVLDEEFEYAVIRNGRQIEALRIRVGMALDGTFYFESQSGVRLYFGKRDGTFYFYRMEGCDAYLKLFFLAIPKLPTVWQDGLSWSDHLPFGLIHNGLRKSCYQLMSAFIPETVRTNTVLTFQSRNQVVSKIETHGRKTQESRITIDDERGFKSLIVGETELRRVDNE